jgi:hypothetical protein
LHGPCNTGDVELLNDLLAEGRETGFARVTYPHILCSHA